MAQKISQSTMVELTISAKDLVNRDKMSKSDPFCVLFQRDRNTNEFLEIGRTEHIMDNLNPVWTTRLSLEYRFQERQELKFALYDWDAETTNIGQHDYLGTVLCSLGEIVSARGKQFEKDLELPKGFKGKSKIIINSEELGDNKEKFSMKINARGLDKKDLLGKSDPFLIISRKNNEGVWLEVLSTEVIKKNLNPDWRVITGLTNSFTGGQVDKKLQFQVFDHDNDGKHDLIGTFEASFLEILDLTKQSKASFPLINPKKKEKKKNYEHSGILNIESLTVDQTNNSFLEYIQTGTHLHFTVAIDFTASNGSPRDPKSLHYKHPDAENQYSLAIKAVGSIIEDYDSDKLFPALGFGAKVPPNKEEVSHMFFLNGNPENPFCKGVSGVLEAYYQTLKTARLYGPTNFAPVINHVSSFASTYGDGRNYFVLLIITDGMICDLDATKEAIINASAFPMSIIIVGVGDEDFSAMKFLDSDTRVLKHNNIEAKRDIVQFIDLKQFTTKHGENQLKAREDLAEQVLAEIPTQFLQHMQITRL